MILYCLRVVVFDMLEKTGFKSRTQLAVAVRESGLVMKDY